MSTFAGAAVVLADAGAAVVAFGGDDDDDEDEESNLIFTDDESLPPAGVAVVELGLESLTLMSTFLLAFVGAAAAAGL